MKADNNQAALNNTKNGNGKGNGTSEEESGNVK
jgi:hypothetical protein